MEPRFTFDRIAGLYDSARAGYPAELFDRLSNFAPPRHAVLEVGCGTGKATAGLLAHGMKIVALDPGPSMIAQAKANIGDEADVRFVQTTFEAWTPDATDFDLITAAQAWHWVPPEIGLPKAAALLGAEGVLAIFGNDWEPVDSGFRGMIDEVYRRLAPGVRDSPLGTWYRSDGPLPSMIEGSGLFSDLEYASFSWSRTLCLDDYLAMLQTLSSHQSLDAVRLKELMDAIESAARPFGLMVDLSYTTHLHHCRRL